MLRAQESIKSALLVVAIVALVVLGFVGVFMAQTATADTHVDAPEATVTETVTVTEGVTETVNTTETATVTETAIATETSVVTETAAPPTVTTTVTTEPDGGSCDSISGNKQGNLITINACGMIISATINELANGSLDLGGIVTVPPVTLPPVTLPPVTAPPVTAPPVTLPPVTAPPVTAPPVTAPPVTVPGPTRTVTVKPEAEISRIIVPGPTVTRTIRPSPRPLAFRPIRETATVRVTQPQETVTATVTEQTGQPTPPRDTMEPTTEPEPDVQTETEEIIKNVFLGTLASLILAGLGILALFLGYALGQRDAKQNEDGFLEGVLDATRIRKR